MPILLSSITKFSFTEAQLRDFIERLNVPAYLFDLKIFQSIIHKMIGSESFTTILEFLNSLDSTSLGYFQRIIRCSKTSAAEIATFLKGEEIELNYLTYYKSIRPIIVAAPHHGFLGGGGAVIVHGGAGGLFHGGGFGSPVFVAPPSSGFLGAPAFVARKPTIHPGLPPGPLFPSPVLRGPSAAVHGGMLRIYL
jgi:hypothetical protein